MSDTESAIEIQRNIQGEVTEDDRCDRPMRIYAFRSVRSRPKGSPATDSVCSAQSHLPFRCTDASVASMTTGLPPTVSSSWTL